MKNITNNRFPKFALEVVKILSDEFPQTYFVGGAVRNILLGKKIVDVDVATSATPTQVTALLKEHGISYSAEHQKLGVILARSGEKTTSQSLEITTFRKEVYRKTRFPKVTFVASPKVDSSRRDFTVNAFYYSLITKQFLDFHNGLKDISQKKLKFIGTAQKKIEQDPLRIVRAYKFSLQYNLQIDAKTLQIFRANINLLKKVSNVRLQKEINSVVPVNLRKRLQKVIHSNA